MSWLLNLYETYQSNLDRVGKIEKKYNGQEYTLLPISHTTQTAHIEVSITEDGEFHTAEIIDKIDANTLIPCTEDSANRAGSKVAPYPLHDKLSYVAGDFVNYGGKIKKEESFSVYIRQLKKWAVSPYATDKVKSIYNYLSKRQLIKDLVEQKVLHVDANDQLIEAWDEKAEAFLGEKPPIFSTVTGKQESAFIRFNVYSPNEMLTKVWKDSLMYDSFIQFYNDFLGKDDYCYVTGKIMPSTDKHANKIRNAGDKAKLISANDTSGFTFRGRFQKANEVANVSYDVSQKAHNALKWLINKQGKIIDQRVFLVWGNDAEDIPDIVEDSYNIFSMDLRVTKKREVKSYTHEQFANEVAKAIDGYKNNLSSSENVNILLLDSATTGRLAVLYYRNMDKKLYLNRLKNWHSTCVWEHSYRKSTDNEFVKFYGAPSTRDIAFAAYGPKANEKVVKGLMERMLPCIIDERKIPFDIVRSAFQRASNPLSMDKWEWEKTLSITCALINTMEGYQLVLDKENIDRDYLFGRLLAIADVLERNSLNTGDQRATNARRYMNSFSQHPERTWKTIQGALQPYQARLGEKVWYYNKLIDEVGSKIKIEDFNNKPLSGKYLLGFYSQRHELYQKKEKNVSLDDAVNNGEEN
ncbi:type I-C CRISPR-associated protein Cas8c/Csd1 [Bacillus thuringiensis]|uniref:Type I-C CRISPR-associated protein Cas8c/Csd1 n=2 Tax=Bacillus cereus group TaxID=86661 RepID=A0ABD6S778_BACTU|nr:type I-C CRISPR-associated protein Cas8c/Csd1 [Bacillus thuringiensis]PER38993.1 type I-C CRISPR-associated protein Cas8c/Csd1 [Bacillus thuringiensis]PEU81941.1 type I-C CRISPR-associated protein Cas8c/Csd1 [Bacillus thuringiensis]PFI04027.1 type I-C CRISPR-associated protein Cas8c/Csd1 [Bacillus thuringiensis]PFW18149.1 type I-C CRISPR-associated protein Cas8c/Csd1 [Bacillus thuringiensis]PGY73660.1 type I-C CRISPR-associated protein Cas8c/Csd1 [Bacillus thuringiensis]